MAHDLAALLTLQQQRTRRAQRRFADAQALWQAAQRELDAAIAAFRRREASKAEAREARIREILAAPASVPGLARIRLQYDMDEEEMTRLAHVVMEARQGVATRRIEMDEAKTHLDRHVKRETKLSQAAARVALGFARRDDVKAEMELER